jgi:crossover junction endodeoxyribonuclease RuvC
VLNRAKPFLKSIISSPKGKEIRIIGVDPGLGATGFGLIEMGSDGAILYRGSGVIRPPSILPFSQRIQRIYRGLAEEIKNYSPHLMAVEQPFFAKNVKSAMLLGQARGVAILAAAEAGVEVYEYSPLEVKQAVVGYGRAAKEQVQAMISSLLHTPKNLKADAADALAVALCLAHSFSLRNSLCLLTVQKSPAATQWKKRIGDRLEGHR